MREYVCPFCGKHYTDFDKFIDCAQHCKVKEDEKQKKLAAEAQEKDKKIQAIEEKLEKVKTILQRTLDEYKALGGTYNFKLTYSKPSEKKDKNDSSYYVIDDLLGPFRDTWSDIMNDWFI